MVESFDAVDVIRMKRDRQTLSPEAINWVIDAYTRGVVADEQMSALAMAIFLMIMIDGLKRWVETRTALTARWAGVAALAN